MAICIVALWAIWRCFACLMLVSRSDVAEMVSSELAGIVRRVEFLTPRGGFVDPKELNPSGVSFSRAYILAFTYHDLVQAPTLGEAITHTWKQSTSMIGTIVNGHQRTIYNPQLWLTIHVCLAISVAMILARRAGIFHLAQAVTGGVWAILWSRCVLVGSLAILWSWCVLAGGLAAFSPWILVGPAEYFWSSLWYQWQGRAWIVTEFGAMWGPFAGAALLYLIGVALVAKMVRFAPASAARDGMSGCPWCGYDVEAGKTCPECGHGAADPPPWMVFVHLDWKMDRRTRWAAGALAGVGVLAYASPLIVGVVRALWLLLTR
ncbi:MAG: zinc ribbon domain-containing protein [Phycisphaeraceae bacterium]|nr:zinc ribbon domain-containing protein [Phycisphaerae bacterium]MBX3392307.1 zinc ribbon domain-containing protein [Phycisphaeraceae bacterium]HRJ49091.1 hypothetical protein [Phycisphaerales bacterium]